MNYQRQLLKVVTTPMNNLRKHTEQGNTELLDAVEKLFEYKKNI